MQYGLPCLKFHSSKDLRQWGIKFHTCFPIPSILQLLLHLSHLQSKPIPMLPSTLLKTLTNALPRSVSPSSPNQRRKKRDIRKKSEIVDLDKLKEDVDLLKNATHWKDHWVIQLITIRGEMHNTFSQPPKQGMLLSSLIFFGCFL